MAGAAAEAAEAAAAAAEVVEAAEVVVAAEAGAAASGTALSLANVRPALARLFFDPKRDDFNFSPKVG